MLLSCRREGGHCYSRGGKEDTVKFTEKAILEKAQWAKNPDFYSWLFYYFAIHLGNLPTSFSLSVKLRCWTRWPPNFFKLKSVILARVTGPGHLGILLGVRGSGVLSGELQGNHMLIQQTFMEQVPFAIDRSIQIDIVIICLSYGYSYSSNISIYVDINIVVNKISLYRYSSTYI